MAIVFRRSLALPLWAIAFGAVALSTLPGVMPPLMALLGIVAIASIMIAMVRWLRTSPPLVEVMSAVNVDTAHAGIIMTAGTRTRTLDEAMSAHIHEPDNAVDLVRMDDDGGWQMASSAPSKSRSAESPPTLAMRRLSSSNG
jgi:hypothetical protein